MKKMNLGYEEERKKLFFIDAAKKNCFAIQLLAHEIAIQLLIGHSLVSLLADIDSSRHSSGFRPRREIDGVAEQTVTRHPMSNYARHDLARVNANGDSLRKTRNRIKKSSRLREESTHNRLASHLHAVRHFNHVKCQPCDACGVILALVR